MLPTSLEPWLFEIQTFSTPPLSFLFFNFVFADVEMQENEESQSVH